MFTSTNSKIEYAKLDLKLVSNFIYNIILDSYYKKQRLLTDYYGSARTVLRDHNIHVLLQEKTSCFKSK